MKYDRKQLMHRVQIALGELHLSSWTLADKKRLYYVEQGLKALDDEQALIKDRLADLLQAYALTVASGGVPTLESLLDAVETLQRGVHEILSPEGVPLRKQIPLKGPAPSKKTLKQLVSVQKNLKKIPKTKAKVK